MITDFEIELYIGLVAKKPDFVACKERRHRPARASAQSDQLLCYSFSDKYSKLTGYMQNVKVFRIIPEFRIFRLFFPRKSASKS